MPDHTGGAHPTTSGRIVSVPASGACSTVRVGGGGTLNIRSPRTHCLLAHAEQDNGNNVGLPIGLHHFLRRECFRIRLFPHANLTNVLKLKEH